MSILRISSVCLYVLSVFLTDRFLMGAGEGGISPSRDIIEVVRRFTARLHILPIGNFVHLGRALLATHCLLWFIIFSVSLAYWLLSPEKLRVAAGRGVKIVSEAEADAMATAEVAKQAAQQEGLKKDQ
jgi:hypothetical protein